MTQETTSQTRPFPTLYVVLGYAITWVIWIPTLLIARREGYVLPLAPQYATLLRDGFRDARHAAVAIIFSLAVYGPLAGALVATRIESGKAGIADLLRRIGKWRVSARWIAAALVVNWVIVTVPLGVGLLTGMVAARDLQSAGLPFLAAAFVLQLLTSGLGEEPGWRGYLWPVLQARHGTNKAIWITGLIWAVWHYPFTIYITLTAMPPGPAAAVIATLVMALAGQTLSLIGMTTLYAWLYNQTQSVALAILFHALSNTMPLAITGVTHPTVNILIALMPWVVVFALEQLLGKDKFPGSKGRKPEVRE